MVYPPMSCGKFLAFGCFFGLIYIYMCGNPFGQGFNSILLVKDLGDVGCFLRWVHGTNMEALAKRDSHQ